MFYFVVEELKIPNTAVMGKLMTKVRDKEPIPVRLLFEMAASFLRGFSLLFCLLFLPYFVLEQDMRAIIVWCMRAIIVWCCLLVLLIEPCMSDIFMHFPPGSNNRLNGNRDNVRNANRLFDSQVRIEVKPIIAIE